MSAAHTDLRKQTGNAGSQRRRNLAIAVTLGLMVMAFYAATFVRFGQPIAAEMLKRSQQPGPQ